MIAKCAWLLLGITQIAVITLRFEVAEISK